jgi:hypothetical protein
LVGVTAVFVGLTAVSVGVTAVFEGIRVAATTWDRGWSKSFEF